MLFKDDVLLSDEAASKISDLHAAVLKLLLVVSRVADLVVRSNVLDRGYCFDGLQARDGPMFAEFALPHRCLPAP